MRSSACNRADAEIARWRAFLSLLIDDREEFDDDRARMDEIDSVATLPLAFARLGQLLTTLDAPSPISAARVQLTRLEVQVEETREPMHWLAAQRIYPRVYFSNQDKSLIAAGVGAAERVDGTAEDALHRLAGAGSARARFYGGLRFDDEAETRQEWASFGMGVFVLPLWEIQICDGGRCYLACHLRWVTAPAIPSEVEALQDGGVTPDTSSAAAPGWERATRAALLVLLQLHTSAEAVPPPQQPLPTLVAHEVSLEQDAWCEAVEHVLRGIENSEWSKVVLAQRVRLQFDAALEPLHLLLRLLEVNVAAIAEDETARPASQDGARHAYLFLLQLDKHAAFMGCTPEKLFKVEGDQLSTEALAGTRPRGDTAEADAALAQDLLHCEKDLREVMAVRDFLKRVLGPASESLHHSDPFILQLRHVQHICVPFFARLNTRSPLSALALLHPTPAVCGTPSDAARRTIRTLERFDRGFYAGPLGYVAKESSEFCVAIRSALLQGCEASIFAGAGIVRGSKAADEWEEVHMKMKNFVSLFPCAAHLREAPSIPASPFLEMPNLNAVCSAVFVEELLRCGLAHVVLCPGSRCAPLTVAVARSGCPHTLANDERGAGFIALGYARASGRCAAVLVSSGTAVANLLPAVVEAAQDNVPLLLLTADRPPEARDTAANQTINQVGLLAGGGLRWFKDVPCPSHEMKVESLLSDASYALACATGTPCGPVHLNFMLREPLAPTFQPWSRDLLTSSPRMSRWMQSRAPFCNYVRPTRGLGAAADAYLLPIVSILMGARRGIIIAGAMFSSAQRRAVAAIAARLQWPVMPDVCSGMRSASYAASRAPIVPMYDLLLSEPSLEAALAVDVVLQIGGRLVSKRLQALVAAASTAVIFVEQHGERMDPDHCVTHRLQGDMPSLLHALIAGIDSPTPSPLLALCEASTNAEAALVCKLQELADVSEPWVARRICSVLSGQAEDEVRCSSSTADELCSQVKPVPPRRFCSRPTHFRYGILNSSARQPLM